MYVGLQKELINIEISNLLYSFNSYYSSQFIEYLFYYILYTRTIFYFLQSITVYTIIYSKFDNVITQFYKCRRLIRLCQCELWWSNQLRFSRFVKRYINFIFAIQGYRVVLPKRLSQSLIHVVVYLHEQPTFCTSTIQAEKGII